MFPRFTRSTTLVMAAAGLLGLAFCGTGEAQTVRKQCSTKYQAAKSAGTLNGQSWNQFYSQCAAEAKAGGAEPAAAPAAAPVTPAEAPAAAPAAAAKPKKTAAPAEPSPDAPVATGPIVFPTAVSPQYSNLPAGAARRKTCDDQYKANKATNSNGGLRWTQKGGGYYSECNKKLKS